MADDDGLPPRRRPQFTVVHKPRVAIRKEPRTDAALVATKVFGDVINADSISDGWVTLPDGGGFMLIDGKSVGLGTLLEPVPPPTTPITLNFSRPDNGKHMLALTLPFDTSIGQTKVIVAKATGLRVGSMVLARGKMGERISDSASNLFDDASSVWSCGYVDGQVPGMMYLGEASDELNEDAKAGTLVVTL